MHTEAAQTEIECQERTRRMVQMHVHANVTPILSYVHHKAYDGDNDAPFTEEDIENFWPDPDEWDADELKEYVDDQGWDWAEITETDPESVDDPSDDELEIVRHFIRANADPPAVYEWYLVSEWLANQLRYHKEVRVSDGLNWYWGRQASGQAVYMDPYMQAIAESWQS